MTDTLHWDLESKSDADLTKVGLDVYSQPSSRPEVLMASYRINNRRLQHWEAREGRFPVELKEALLDPEVEKWAFMAQFERVMTRRVLKIDTPRKGWRCSMVLAYMQSFMGGLGDVGEQIGLPLDKQKMKDGKRLVRKFSIPQKITKNQPYLWRNWITDPDDWELFGQYNDQDVITEEAIKTRLIRFPIMQEEWDFYELDQLINDRGIPLDMDFIDNVIWMNLRRKNELMAQMTKITGISNPNSVSQLLPWLQERGYPYADLQKESVEKSLKRLKKEEIRCTPGCKAVMELRQWAARTSVTKAVTAKRCVGEDGRARYLFQFAGAGRTNRFAGRIVQTQNMMRTPKCLEAEENDEKLTCVTDLIRTGDYDGFDLVLTEPMLGLTGCMRSMLRAPDGDNLMVCDYSTIETIGTAWITGAKRQLKSIRAGRDPYKEFAVDFYKVPYEEVTRAQRQICKPPVLACGYRLSAGTDKDGVKTGLLKYAEDMGVEMTQEEATRAVKIYREVNPEIPKFWYNCEKAIKSVLTTGQPYKLGYLTFEWMKPYLLIRLPKGRCIFYYKPRLEQRVIRTGKMINKRIRSRGYFEDGAPEGQWITIEEEETYIKTVFTYMGKNQKNNQWTRLDGHGGIVLENVVQAFTRDILMVGGMRLHKDGFYLIGHSHDEWKSQIRVGENFYTLERKRELMIAPIDWAPGFPLNAAGWTGPFYRKA